MPKTHTTNYQDIVDLVTASIALPEDEREYWLEQIKHLDNAGLQRLTRSLQRAHEELQQEREQHLSRMAEIHAKCEKQLNSIVRDNHLTPPAGTSKEKKSYVDQVLDDNFLKELDNFDY